MLSTIMTLGIFHILTRSLSLPAVWYHQTRCLCVPVSGSVLEKTLIETMSYTEETYLKTPSLTGSDPDSWGVLSDRTLS